MLLGLAGVMSACIGQRPYISPVTHGRAATGKSIDGISCDQGEGSAYHIHTHLTLVQRGKVITLPAGIGYGPGDCLYWLHTHDTDGVIHVEAPAQVRPTLKQFFDIWGQSLSRFRAGPIRSRPGRPLRVYLDHHIFAGDPAKILLRDHEDVALESGPPYKQTASFDWSGY